jgi:predicted TPR repeat methyltransferase
MKQAPIERAIHLHQAGKTDKARSIYLKLLKKNPNDVDALHFYGILNFQQGKPDRAIELIKRSIENKPDYPDAHNNLGNIYLKLERLDDAQPCFEKTLQLAPERIETHNNLGVLLQYLEDYPGSIQHLLKALEIKPDWADAHYNLANTYALSGNDKEAMRHYRAAIEYDPKFSLALKRLGMILYSQGKTDEAIELYKDWQELEPDNPVVKHMLAACSGEKTPDRASNEYLVETFDNFATSFDNKLENLEYRAPQLITDAVKSKLTESKRALNVLDAGCGTGLCGPLLKPLARKLSGVDLSPNMLKLAKERKCYDGLVCEDLVSYIKKFTDKYDVIVSADTLVYFGDLKEALDSVSNALKPGGLFAFSVEDLGDETFAHGYKLQSHGRYAHNLSYIERTAKEVGLVLSSMKEETLRLELKQPVEGLIVTLTKPA